MNTFAKRTAAGDFVAGNVCRDCFVMLTDGSEPDSPKGWLWDSVKGQKMEATLEQYEITIGHFHSGNEYDIRCDHNGSECEDDCPCERVEFSRAECTVCNDTFAGNRYDVIMVER